jgi:protein-tyrosine phosphatase
MGNICRSPMAEGVLRRYLEEAGLAERVATDSAGTHGYHVGEPPDPRAQRAAGRRGYDISGLRGRQVQPADFSEFDYVLAMDEANLRALARICPPEHAEKLRLFMEFAPDGAPLEVPDPYYGGPQGFERVLDQLEQAARGLIEHLRARIGA